MAANPNLTGNYPEGEQQAKYVGRRQRSGSLWATVFMASTLVGIIALAALLFNIIDSAFGYVAVQNKIDPETIVRNLEETRLLNAANLTTSEDDEELAAGVASDPNAVGFFGYAYYQEHADALRTLSVEGVAPNAETVDSGDYPLARPLYIYTTADALRDKPQVAAYVTYYLNHVNAVIGDVGYFPASDSALSDGVTRLHDAIGPDAPTTTDGNILIAGSSTVYPLTQPARRRLPRRGLHRQHQHQQHRHQRRVCPVLQRPQPGYGQRQPPHQPG